MTNLTVANEIRNQIGNKALFMIGAKNLAADEKSLTFKIMRNSKSVTHVKIELTSMDDYTMTFYSIRGTSVKVKAEIEGVYCDQINATIREQTELNTNL